MQADPLYLRLSPNCSTTPKVLMSVLGLIASMSICIGLVFWAMGAPLILPFALIESLLLAVAFVCHARTRSDFDEITFSDDCLLVRQARQGQEKVHRFTRSLFWVSMTEGPHSRVRVGESGRHVELGEWLLPQERLALCKQLSASASLAYRN
jgi:uncharacterized membrane protein